MPTRSIIIKANVAVIINFPERSVSFNLRYAANMIAPAAPRAAAGVGLVMPPRLTLRQQRSEQAAGKQLSKAHYLQAAIPAVLEE